MSVLDLGELGDASVVPDVAALLHDPSVSKEAEECMVSLFHKSDDLKIKALMQQGTTALSSEKFVQALSLFESITVIDPDFAEVPF